MNSERDLWEGFKQGEGGALIKIYDLYIGPLYRYGRKFSANDELIKDTVQDLFLDLIRTSSNLGHTDQIYFYLLKAFRRRLFRSLNELKKTKLNEGEYETPEALIIYSVEDEWMHKEQLSKKEQIIRKGLEKLSPKQREIIYYRFTCDFEYEQICELMSIKYDSARKMMFRALQTLREHISEASITLFSIHLQRVKSFIKNIPIFESTKIEIDPLYKTFIHKETDLRDGYLKLKAEELIMDREFLAWILHGNNHQKWDIFQDENPGFKASVAKARQIIELLRDRPDSLSESDIQEIRQNLLAFEQQTLLQPRKKKIRLVWRYAASLLLMLSVGSAGFWMVQQNSQSSYAFKSTAEQGANAQSRLLLSDGTNVPLEKDNSKIALTRDQQILIDNDQIIDVSKSDQEDETKMNEVVIPYGSRSQLMLADGTKVWLNAGSRLAFPTKFHGKKREVYLEGEAYFEVAKNTEMPFFVNAGEIAVKVLGTKFNISAYVSEQSIAAVLLEGKVSMNKRSSLGFLANETIITPHHRGTYLKSQDVFQVQYEPDIELAIAWTEGWFKFSQVSLTDVFKNLERYYNVKFRIDHKFPSDEIITGKLDLKESIEHVMAALSDISNIQFRIKDKEIFIEEKMDIINMRK